MRPVERLIGIAEKEVGYCEKSEISVKQNPKVLDEKVAGAGADNYTKYSRSLINWIGSPYSQGQPWCFVEGTMVLTSKGYKNIEELKIGDKVLNAYGDSFNTVVDIAKRMSKTCEVRAYGMPKLVTTPDHPFLSNKRLGVRKGGKYSSLCFNPINELKHGDNLIIPHTNIVNNLELTYDEAWIVGYYVGDGWKSSKNAYHLCGNKTKEVEIYKHIKSIHKDKDYKSRTCYEYRIIKEDNANIISILDEANCGAVNKEVPQSILFARNDIKEAFLDGYLTADGTKDLQFCTVSKKLAYGLAKIIFDLGYGCSLRICVRNEDQEIFDKRINAYRKIHIQPIIYNGSINKSVDNIHRMDSTIDNLVYTPLKHCKPLLTEQLVYNITTDNDHTYLANNLAVHNCDIFADWCFIIAFGLKVAKEMIGGWSAYTPTSASYYKGMGRWFNVPRPGDQIFFSNGTRICHTGIVYKVDSVHVYTIEGNTSTNTGLVTNGGCVAKKMYPLSYSRISGYGRPKYNLVKDKEYLYKGVDVSAAQTKLDYVKLKDNGVEFAIIKIIRKDLNPDKMFEKHYNGFTSAGIPIFGVYNYSYATTVEKAKTDAETVLKVLGGRKVLVCMDVEDKVQTGLGKRLIDIINEYQRVIESAGLPFLLYTGLSFYNTYIKPWDEYLKCKNLWIARYYKSSTVMPFIEDPDQSKKPMDNIIGWQYTSSGSVPGYNGNLDLDIIYEDVVAPEVVSSKNIVTRVKTNGSRLNVRNVPNGAIVGRLDNGTEINVLDIKDQWFKIGTDRYVSRDYVASNTKGVVTTGALNCRSSDSAKGSIIGRLFMGNEVDIFKQSSTGWYLTTCGWVSNNYVKL